MQRKMTTFATSIPHISQLYKLVQCRLRWFGHIKRRLSKASVRNRVISRTGNGKRSRGRSNLTWEESMKRDLKDWSVNKEPALDRREWKLAIHRLEH
jgi:hypothetical protein